MIKYVLIFFYISCLNACQLFAQDTSHVASQDTLPDDYLQFTLSKLDDRYEGSNEYLEGFRISMDIHPDSIKRELDVKTLMSIVRDQTITGTLTYPSGKTTEIEYEIVHHRDTEDIYMKTTLGYFLWEMVSIQDDTIYFAIYWWYCPPARKVDLDALVMAEQLLADSTHWHKDDDRRCDEDMESNRWSLFCALKHASIEKMGEYNHHNTAMQTVRFVIDDILPHHEFEHTLMDYNNAQSTKHADILRVLEIAKERITQEIENDTTAKDR